MQILTFFSKNSLSIYTALKKYKIRGSKNGHVRNFQVMPLLNPYKLHLDIFFRATRARALADFSTSDFTPYGKPRTNPYLHTQTLFNFTIQTSLLEHGFKFNIPRNCI